MNDNWRIIAAALVAFAICGCSCSKPEEPAPAPAPRQASQGPIAPIAPPPSENADTPTKQVAASHDVVPTIRETEERPPTRIPAQVNTTAIVAPAPTPAPAPPTAPLVTQTIQNAPSSPAPPPTSSEPPIVPLAQQAPKPPIAPMPPPAPLAIPVAAPAPPLPSPLMCALPRQKIGLRLFAALGINYVRYSEDLTDVITNYADLRGPSMHLGIGMDLGDESSVEATYKSTPFRFDNSSVGDATLSGTWQTLSVQGIAKSRTFTANETAGSEYAWLYGFQIHQVPYALFENATNKAVVRPIQLIDLSLGGRWRKMINPWTRTEIFLRGQYPISTSSTGSTFSAKGVLLFDGSIGAEKKVTDLLWVGLHWYGQYHNLKFKYNDSLVTAEGSHSTLFSNLEVRLTWDF